MVQQIDVISTNFTIDTIQGVLWETFQRNADAQPAGDRFSSAEQKGKALIGSVDAIIQTAQQGIQSNPSDTQKIVKAAQAVLERASVKVAENVALAKVIEQKTQRAFSR